MAESQSELYQCIKEILEPYFAGFKIQFDNLAAKIDAANQNTADLRTCVTEHGRDIGDIKTDLAVTKTRYGTIALVVGGVWGVFVTLANLALNYFMLRGSVH